MPMIVDIHISIQDGDTPAALGVIAAAIKAAPMAEVRYTITGERLPPSAKAEAKVATPKAAAPDAPTPPPEVVAPPLAVQAPQSVPPPDMPVISTIRAFITWARGNGNTTKAQMVDVARRLLAERPKQVPVLAVMGEELLRERIEAACDTMGVP